MPLSLRRPSSLARQHPPSPAIIVVTAPAAPVLDVLPPPSPSRQPPLSSAATIIVATKPSLPAAAAANHVLFGQSTFSRTEELDTNKSKAKECNLLFTAQFLRKLGLFQDFQRVQI